MDSVPQHETITVEFKSDRKTIPESTIVDEVVALANTDGGLLYIGVEDDGSITGAQEQHRDVIRMQALVANRTVPPVSVRATLVGDGLPALCLEVPRSQSIVASSSGRVLRRRLRTDGQPESAPLYPHEMVTRLSDMGRLDYSAQPVDGATRADFDPLERERLRDIVRTYNTSDKQLLELADEELERALRLTARVGEQDVPTLAGLLLIGHTESLQRLAPTAQASFQVLQGTDIRVNATYGEALLSTIERILDAIEPWNPVTELTHGAFNEPVPLFDKRAVREAVVNAFGHRDYSVLGRVRVLIDDAGLTVANPGGFVEGISQRNLLTAEPHGRNPCLMDAFKRLGLAERTGRGIDRIYEGSLRFGRPLPDYSASTSAGVNLFIARGEPDALFVEFLTRLRQRAGSSLSIQALLVLDALRGLQQADEGTLLGELDVSQARLQQVLAWLVGQGAIVETGMGGSAVYALGGPYGGEGGATADMRGTAQPERRERAEIILAFVDAHGSITTADACELLGLERSSAYYEIRKLVKQGQLEKLKNGRDACYTRP